MTDGEPTRPEVLGDPGRGDGTSPPVGRPDRHRRTAPQTSYRKRAPRLSKIVTSGLIKWGTRGGAGLTQREPRLRLIEDSPITAGVDTILLALQRSLSGMHPAIPAIRTDDRIFRHAFGHVPVSQPGRRSASVEARPDGGSTVAGGLPIKPPRASGQAKRIGPSPRFPQSTDGRRNQRWSAPHRRLPVTAPPARIKIKETVWFVSQAQNDGVT